jgi:hypothetical protein
MTHSGFKTAQKIVNLGKKENNNKDYRCKQKIHEKYSFSNSVISFDYVLRTKHGICINEKNKKYIQNSYSNFINNKNKNLILINFEEHTEEENTIIQEEINIYWNTGITQLLSSTDKTKSHYSKKLAKNRNKARDNKKNDSVFIN